MYVAIYGFTNIKEGLDKKNTANYDSYSIKYYDMDDTYFKKYAFTISVVFSGPNLSISDVETQQKIDHILQVKRQLTYFMFSFVIYWVPLAYEVIFIILTFSEIGKFHLYRCWSNRLLASGLSGLCR